MSLRIDELPEFFKRLLEVTKDAVLEETGLAAENITADMREPGSPITYPVNWDSEKQKRFVLAKLKKDNDLPYTRKGDYEKSWTKTELPNGWQVSAKHPAGAIGGVPREIKLGAELQTKWQSKIHKGRWKEFAKVATQHLKELPRRVIDRISVKVKTLD